LLPRERALGPLNGGRDAVRPRVDDGGASAARWMFGEREQREIEGEGANRGASVTPGFRRQTECEPCTCQDQQFTYTTVT
jgi:hypothetical protein